MAASMVNNTFLKEGKRKGKERRKEDTTGFTSLGYLHTVNRKPSSPPEQDDIQISSGIVLLDQVLYYVFFAWLGFEAIKRTESFFPIFSKKSLYIQVFY